MYKSWNMDSRHYNPKALKELRLVRGETQEQVAKALNVTRQTIYRLEAGQDVGYGTLCNIAGHYGIDVVRLLYPKPLRAEAAA